MARGSGQKAKPGVKPGGVSSEHQEMFWCCAWAALRDGSVSVLGRLQKMAGHGHGQPALVVLLEQGLASSLSQSGILQFWEIS